jgi:FSR family fosmidomycin resistance protein-like MFS transporter
MALSRAPSLGVVLVAVALVGIGSAIFHPESSRVARMASGGQHGLAQSLFQVGGNLGSSLGPLLVVFVVLPRGQGSVAWFSLAALLAMAVLIQVGGWYKRHHPAVTRPSATSSGVRSLLPSSRVVVTLAILLALIFSKYVYLASLVSYYTFYLIARFHISVQSAQLHLFIFLGAVAAVTCTVTVPAFPPTNEAPPPLTAPADPPEVVMAPAEMAPFAAEMFTAPPLPPSGRG